MRLADARAFVFDLDGTLVDRSASGVRPRPGAPELLDAIRASGRPLTVFTNASHVVPGQIARGARAGGLPLGDDEVLTAGCSALGHVRREHPQAGVLVIGTDAVRARMAGAGVRLVHDAAAADVVLTLHVDEVALEDLEAAAWAVIGGAPFLTGNYVRAYAGADGPILSRGAMVAAAIAKAAGSEPTVVGKPSLAAVREYAERLGTPPQDVVVVGDDVEMDIALGRLGGSRTVLVRSGIGGGDPATADLVVDGVGDLLALL